MDFICPNCTKMIAVPDQYAGQPMRCPICQQTFQAPSLPSSAPVPAVPWSEAPPPPPEESVYKLSPEHAPAAPPPKPESAAPPRTDSIRPEPKASTPPPSPPPPPPPPPAGYARKFSIQLSPQVLPWIPAVALGLVFVLTFFNWVGMYPGGITVYAQNVWQVFYGGGTPDPVFATKVFPDEFGVAFDEGQHSPQWSALALLYLLSFLPALVLVIAITAVAQLQVKLPPVVQPFLSWRYLIVAGLTVIPLFFVLLQSLTGFPLEGKLKTLAVSKYEGERKAAKTNDETQKVEIEEGMAIGKLGLHRTSARSIAVLLHFLAPICALLAFWIERRGPSRPLPRIEALW